MTKPADKFLQLCAESDQLPDVFKFLSSCEGLSPRAQVDVMLVDQFQRWKQNQIIPVDQYLERTPHLDDVLKVELLIEEYGYLDQRGIAPTAEEFADRFRFLAPEARRELYDALELDAISDHGSSGSEQGVETSAPPEFIGRYEVVRSLGKGAFGNVFLAKDLDLDRSVAIKVPTDKRIKMGGGADEFLNEAKAVAKLDHPNIVPVYDCGMTPDDRCFVVSKYVRGRELRAEIRKGISHREAAHIAATLARALHVAHVAGIVHRDVKPGNIIIDSKRRPHLLDFGLALRDQDAFDSDALVGTPAYMSPEQAQCEGHRIDGRSDIYSLAVVLYEMLTGHRPCKSERASEVIEHIKFGEVRPLRQSDDTVPLELERICMKALSRNLSDRYNTAKDMADEIDFYLQESSTEGDSWADPAFDSRSYGSHLRLPSKHQTRRPLVAFLRSPATIIFGVLLAVMSAVIAFTNPPWETPGSTTGAQPVPIESVSDETNSVTVASRPSRLAVIGFRDVSKNPQHSWMATGLAELLTEELEKSNELALIANENVSLMKADLGLIASESLGSSTLERIDRRIGADWIVMGTFATTSDASNQIRIDVTAQNTTGSDSKIRFSRTTNVDQWPDLVPIIGAQLRREFGCAAPDISSTGQLFPPLPAHPEAWKNYFEGIASLRAHDPVSALNTFKEASANDPNSPLVLDSLAQAAQLLGDEKSARHHSARAVELSGGLTSAKQMEIKGRHFLLEGRPAEAVSTYRSLFELRNRAMNERLLLASALTAAGQGWAALELLGEARAQPRFGADIARIELAAAQAAQSVSEYSQQVKFSKEASLAAREVGARLIEGLAQLNEGQAQRRVGEYETAYVCFARAFELLTKQGDRQNAARALGAWGKALVDQGQLDAAESKINEGLELSRLMQNQRLIARLTGQLGEVAVYRGKFADASTLLQESLDSFTELDDRQGIADMNLTLANVQARTGNLDEALIMVGAARKAFQASGDRRGEARTWGQEGAMRGRQGDTREAQRYFERALELFREVGDRHGMAIGLGDLGTTNSNQGHLTKAAELYSEALELHRQMGSKRGPEMVMFNLSMLYARTGRMKDAHDLMLESLTRYENQGKWMNACFVQRKLGDLKMHRGELQEAKKVVAAALAKSREVGSVGVEAQSLATQSDISIYEGKIAEATKQINESRTLSTKLKQKINVAACDLVLARLEMRKGKFDGASKLFQNAETEMASGKPELLPMLLFIRAQIEARQGKREAASASLAKAELAIDESDSEDVGIELLAKHERALALAALDRGDEAIEELETISRLANEYGWISMQLESDVERFELEHAAGKPVSSKTLANLEKQTTAAGFIDLAQRTKQLLLPSD